MGSPEATNESDARSAVARGAARLTPSPTTTASIAPSACPTDRRGEDSRAEASGRQVLRTVQDERFAPAAAATLTRDRQAALARLLRLAIGA